MADQTKLILKSISWADYSSLVNNNTLDPKTLYFINDKGQIYTHGKLYGGKWEFYSTLPLYPELNTLYISNTDLSTKIWDGTNWHVVSKGYTLSIGHSSDDTLIPTAKAVYDFVTSYTPGGGGGVSSISWNSTNEQIEYEIGDATRTVPLTGLAHDPSYDQSTRTLTIPVVGGSAVSVQLEDSVVTAGKYNAATNEIWLSIADDGSYDDPDKVIKIPVSGLVDIYTGDDTDSIEVDVTNNVITADARISSKAGNILSIEHTSGQEGLYVPDPSSAIAGKASKVASGNAGKIIVADVNGDNALGTASIGGVTLDPTNPDSTKVSTEAAVVAFGQSVEAAANAYADGLVEWVNW